MPDDTDMPDDADTRDDTATPDDAVTPAGSPVIPGLRYRDAKAAVDWLCRVVGFEARLVVPGEGESIAHAQLTLGRSMIMLGSQRDDEFGRLLRGPQAGEGGVTQGAYIVVPDADAVYERVVASGVEIPLPIEDQDYGGRGFTCRDPEGHVWSIGSYDPWAEG